MIWGSIKLNAAEGRWKTAVWVVKPNNTPASNYSSAQTQLEGKKQHSPSETETSIWIRGLGSVRHTLEECVTVPCWLGVVVGGKCQ